jgi:hypothetical protein
MTFNEKSAWSMILILFLVGAIYVRSIAEAFFQMGEILPPGRMAIIAVVAIIALSILFHIIVAISNPSDANEALDERDKIAMQFAGYWSGIALGVCVVGSLLAYLLLRSGDLLFHFVFLSLVLASLFEYGLLIFAYRRAV